LFVLEYDRLNLVVGALAGRLLAHRIAFRVLPNFDAWSRRTWWREISKRLLFRAVDAAKVPGPDGARLAMRYGVPRSRTRAVRQSIDLDHYSTARSMTPRQRAQERRLLGLTGCVFIFVGRIWRGKGIDELVTAYTRLAATEDVSLVLVGDGVDELHYRQLTDGVPRVVFGGFVQPADLPCWYALADCLVFPTHGDPNGLVVEEALAAGLPLIVSDAAGDIRARLGDGEVGIVVPSGSAQDLEDAMRRIAVDPEYRKELAEATEARVAERTTEGYALDFQTFASSVLAAPPRRSAAAWLCRLLGAACLAVASLAGWQLAPLVGSLPADHETRGTAAPGGRG
jgi:glycosyltransferase involved in cell wall biosynthesis